MFLDEDDVAAWLQAMPDKRFIEFFYKHLAERRIKSEDVPGIDNHLALAEVRRVPNGSGGLRAPVVELPCTSPKPACDDAPVEWRGTCCGFQTGSWRRFATCPVCGREVRDA